MNENSDPLVREALLKLGRRLDEMDVVEKGFSFLDDAASLWRFSATNVLALQQQAAERGQRLELLASSGEWLRHGRTTMRKEEPYVILVPATASQYAFVPGAAVNSAGFRAAHVFDLSQTYGRPFEFDPALAIEPMAQSARLYAELQIVADEAGFRVVAYDDQYSVAHGMVLYESGEIHVPRWQPLTERTAILAHELAHGLLHGSSDPMRSRYSTVDEYHGLAELEAESAAYIVLRAHGIDSTVRSATYLSGWAERVRAAQPDMVLFGRSPPERSDLMRAVMSRSMSAAQTMLASTSPVLRGGAPPARDPELLRELSRLGNVSKDVPVASPAPDWRRSVGLD